MAVLHDAAAKLKSIGCLWDLQTGFSKHGSSIALIVFETEEGSAAGYVASLLGNELANTDGERFAQEVADHITQLAIETAKHAGI